jgi:hypothetical protein
VCDVCVVLCCNFARGKIAAASSIGTFPTANVQRQWINAVRKRIIDALPILLDGAESILKGTGSTV